MRGKRRSALDGEIGTLRRTLLALDRSLQRLGPLLSAGMPRNGRTDGNGRSRPRLSAKVRASLVLQGRYMGFMRQLKPRQKARVRKVKEAKGVRVAISRAREMARGEQKKASREERVQSRR